jgi:hypothetical protein
VSCFQRREQELLSELDERIEACQAKIHFNEQQIMALAPGSKSLTDPLPDAASTNPLNSTFVSTTSSMGSDAYEDQDRTLMCCFLSSLFTQLSFLSVEDVPDVSGANTLPEAKTLLKLLFRMLVDMKRTDRVHVRGHFEFAGGCAVSFTRLIADCGSR